MKKYILLILFFSISFSISFSLSFASATSTATTTKKVYKLPKEGVRIKVSDANFSFFPTELPFAPGRNIFLVSRKWQTACLYDENGKLFIPTSTTSLATTTMYYLNKPLCVQSATGRKELPTELGLYNIQTKQNKDYKSTFYTNTGDKPEKKDQGAPMPYAIHIGRIIGQDATDGKLWYDFSDGTAVHEKQTVNKNGAVSFVSHGCIAVEKGMGKTLQNIMSYGDLVLVFNETIPNSLSEMVSISN